MKRILYLTGDNRLRASSFSLFLPLWKELKLNSVDIMEYNTFKPYPNLRKDIFNGKNVPYLNKTLNIPHINNNYDIIVIENIFPYWNEDWYKIKAKKVIILGDLHRFNPNGTKFPSFMFDIQERIGISAVLTKYIENYHKNFNRVGLPVYHWPHSISTSVFYDYNLKKEYGILSTGSINGIYPKRQILHNLLKDKKYYKRINRPNNRMDLHPNAWPINNDYAKELNKAKICIACTSIYNYTIAKVFEIPASNSVLLCDYTNEMKDLGFIPEINFIEYTENIDYIEEILNSDKLKDICYNGFQLVHKKHTTQQRVKEFLQIMEKI